MAAGPCVARSWDTVYAYMLALVEASGMCPALGDCIHSAERGSHHAQAASSRKRQHFGEHIDAVVVAQARSHSWPEAASSGSRTMVV